MVAGGSFVFSESGVEFSDEEFDIMINVALSLEPLWENAVGKDWRKTITPEKLRGLYELI